MVTRTGARPRQSGSDKKTPPGRTAVRVQRKGARGGAAASKSVGQPEKVNVFISYASGDSQVAKALYDELIDINRDRVDCFLDTETIHSGYDWEQKLESALAAAHWLVCIYTGEQSEFCGYEIGVFTRGKALEKTVENSLLVCLHDVAEYPAVFKRHQNRFIDIPPKNNPPGQIFNETEFYENSQIARFFADFCKYKDLYVPTEDVLSHQRYTSMIVAKSKKVTEAFRDSRGTDIRADTPTQLGIEVSFPWSPDQPVPGIPDNARVKGTMQSFSLFGLMPHLEGEQLPTTSWADIKATGLGRRNGYLPWVERLERDMLAAANRLNLDDGEATFRTKEKTYRAILVRHILLFNGTHRFGIVFVETLPRQFIGHQNTSMILAGLVVASRFRFAYLEKPERFEAGYSDDLPDHEFEANYRQFLYDLERLRQEAMELGLLDDISFVQSFGPARRAIAESFLKTANDARQQFEQSLPPHDAPIGPNNRQTVKRAIETYLRLMEAENSRFLLAATEAYRDELNAHLRARAAIAATPTPVGQ